MGGQPSPGTRPTYLPKTMHQPTGLSVVKILLLGPISSGRHCLAENFAGRPFRETQEMHIGDDCEVINQMGVRFQLWMTQIGRDWKHYKSIRTSSFKTAQTVLLTVDPTSDDFFRYFEFHLKEIQESCADSTLPVYFVCTKADLRPDLCCHDLRWEQAQHLFYLREHPNSSPQAGLWASLPKEIFRKIILAGHSGTPQELSPTRQQICDLAKKHKLPVFFVSAKTGYGVSEMFQTIAERMIREDKEFPEPPQQDQTTSWQW